MADKTISLPWRVAEAATDTNKTSAADSGAKELASSLGKNHRRLDLETAYGMWRPRLLRYLASLGVDLMEAEDITHEVFVNIFRREPARNVTDDLFYWALVCAKNLARNRYRRGRREILAPASAWKEWEETIRDPGAGPDMELQEAERYRALMEWVADLSGIEQKCALMRSQGTPFREMATVLNLPMRRVIYVTSLAFQKLKRRHQRQLQ